MNRPAASESPTLDEIYRDIQADLELVEDRLRFYARSNNRLISEVGSYLFQKSGKRIRPALVLLCSRLFGYLGDERILMSALVEIIHTASLVHDDIIDNSRTRRGSISAHARWGPNITVLLGDYLYINAIKLALKSRFKRVIEILSSASARMIEGELVEYSVSGNLDLTEEEYLDILNKKTASLFAASCEIGGLLGEASEREERWMSEYGTNMGMAFQMIDDLLDFEGDESLMGKPILSDLREGRITLPVIYTLNNDGKAGRERIHKVLKKDPLGKKSKEDILCLLRANGALDYTRRLAEKYSQQARDAILRFRESPFRENLKALAVYILGREK